MENQFGQAQQTQITSEMIKNSKILECDCGGKIFEENLMIKKLSPLLTQSGNEEMVPMRVVVCKSCGKVPREFDSDGVIPEELKTEKK